MFNKDTPVVGSGTRALSHIVLRWKPANSTEFSGHELFDAVQTSEAQAKNAATSRAARFQISGTPIQLTYYYADGSKETFDRVSI